MAQIRLTSLMDSRNQVLCGPDTELKKIILEVYRLLDFDPKIRELVERDLNRAALEAKKGRMVEAVDRACGTPAFPGMEPMTVDEAQALDSDTLTLGIGRSRAVDAEAVCVMAMCRGHLDSLTSKSARDRITDSIILSDYFEGRGMAMPARSTIHAWVNCVSKETYAYIFDAQLALFMHDGLDDFNAVTADSFSVWANTSWPTDSAMIHGLLDRAWRTALKLNNFGLPSFTQGCVPRWLEELRKLDRDISFACGKPNSKRKVRRLYKKIYDTAEKLMKRLDGQFEHLLPAWDSALNKMPVKVKGRLEEMLDQIMCDLSQAARVVAYSWTRNCEGKSVPVSEKVLSLSDPSASFIKKGAREPVIGYKPQIMRSLQGFITAFELQQGNPNDAARLLPLTRQHIERTGVVPAKCVSVDDGYSSGPNRADLRSLGIETVSMNGAKGRKITPEDEWSSPEYETARNARSAVESLVFTLRYKFHLYRFSRRGIEDVELEMYEKVIAHNLWRASLLRERAAAQDRVALLKTA